MYETMTPEALKALMLAQINESQGISSMAGGFADGVIGPVAERMSNVYMSLDAVPDMLFVTENSGAYIDKVGQQYYNITRRPGTRAYCDISLTGTPGLVIAQGTQFLTAGGLAFSLLGDVTIPSGGTAAGRLEAAEVGSVYNVDAGAIDRMYINLAGLTGYTNEAATGGTDPESDAALLERIRERVQQPATSGNGYQYRQWAMAVPGVGQAKVVELANGAGTVGVTIVSGSYQAPGEEILDAVESAIAQQRPIGAEVTVIGSTEMTVDVAASVTLTQGATAGGVQDAFRIALAEYCKSLVDAKFSPIYYSPGQDGSYTLLYNRVLAILLTIPGVENFTSLTVNSGTSDITITADQIPVLGTVSVT